MKTGAATWSAVETSNNAKKALQTLEGIVKLNTHYTQSPETADMQNMMTKIQEKTVVLQTLSNYELVQLQETGRSKDIEEQLIKIVNNDLSTPVQMTAVQKIELEITFKINRNIELFDQYLLDL